MAAPTRAKMRAEMEALREDVYARWISGGRGNLETLKQRDERHALTSRWYSLRRQLRAGR